LLQALGEECDGLSDDVEAALDEHASFATMLATRQRVDDLSRRYREAIARITDEKDKFAAERTYGRRVSDLQKMASRLPAAPEGKPAEKLVDDSFFGTRAPKSSRPPFVPGLQPDGVQPELLVDQLLAAVRVGRHQVNGQAVA
jgi:hypothetical protein